MMEQAETAIPDGFLEWKDAEHLRLLCLIHYVFAGVYALMACIPILHFGMGALLAFRPDIFGESPSQQPPAMIGYILMGIAGGLITLGWTFAGVTAWSGRCIRQRRHRLFSIVIAALNCLSIPFGTLLGVFTIMVLEGASVRELYARNRRASQ